MKLTKKQQKFIKEAYTSPDVCKEWKGKIINNFPKLFDVELKTGRWYKDANFPKHLFYLTRFTTLNLIQGIGINKYDCYGFDTNGVWCDKMQYHMPKTRFVEALEEEIYLALMNEAKKRGFTNNTLFNPINDERNTSFTNEAKVGSSYKFQDGKLYVTGYGKSCIFKNGEWATLVEEAKEMTVSEISKELGYKVKVIL